MADHERQTDRVDLPTDGMLVVTGMGGGALMLVSLGHAMGTEAAHAGFQRQLPEDMSAIEEQRAENFIDELESDAMVDYSLALATGAIALGSVFWLLMRKLKHPARKNHTVSPSQTEQTS